MNSSVVKTFHTLNRKLLWTSVIEDCILKYTYIKKNTGWFQYSTTIKAEGGYIIKF